MTPLIVAAIVTLAAVMLVAVLLSPRTPRADPQDPPLATTYAAAYPVAQADTTGGRRIRTSRP